MPRVQQKRGTAANLTSVNPTPLAGELIVVTDENTLVIGNGSDSYTSLAYVTATPRSHTHLFSEISDITFPDPLADNSIVVYSAGVGWITASTIGLIGVGSQPLGGWPSGSLGSALAGKASTTHASSHATGGSDALSPADIGAAPAASPSFSGTVTNSGLVRWEYPDKALDGAVSDLGYLRVYDETGFAAGLGVSTSSFNIGTQGAINLRFVTNGTQRAIINTAGNVGIGTNEPASLLHVNGVITVSAGSAAAPALVSGTGTSDSGLYWPAADTVAISTGGVERVRVDSFGRMSIATPGAASFALFVNSGSNGQTIDVRGRASDSVSIFQFSNSAGTLISRIVNSTTDMSIRAASSGRISLAQSDGTNVLQSKSTGSVRFVPLAADPASGNEAGDVYYNSSTNKLRVYNGTSWVDLH